ncbi:phospholipase D-like domain-containing protein [Streptomyces sp. NPDC004647]|uniref:phospholipase D-like domain-containing protein n=1 Tax=Streptomyces sp. NPDC004647 TaxID=3154671 RepID=UPI0033B4622F
MTLQDQPRAQPYTPETGGAPGDQRQRLRRRLEGLIGTAATEGNALLPLRNGWGLSAGGPALLRRPARLRVRTWQPQPTMMHAKVITIDSVASLIGSTNLNRRSLDHDGKSCSPCWTRTSPARLDGHFEEDLAGQRTHGRRPLEETLRGTASERDAMAPIRCFL